MGATVHPLPRSLDPLPDESLPGFVLRLAHRLDLSPADLIWRMGCGGRRPSSPPAAAHLLMLEAASLAAFSTSTGLSPSDVEALTLRSFLEHYPPLTRALVREGSQPRPRSVFPSGILFACSRYCPLCLAGDGSPIQDKYGGPWKRHWRLAITFACLKHNVFLRHDCPACGQLALSGDANSKLRLLPAAAVHGLHAVQCRNNAANEPRSQRLLCRQRLDQVPPPHPELSPSLADLQRRLLDRLDPAYPAELASREFADLHVASAIIKAAWPAAVTHVPEETRTALAAHISDQEILAQSTSPPTNISRTGTAVAWTTPPPSAPATAALLATAELLTTSAFQEGHDTLTGLLREAPGQRDPRWDDTWRTLARDSSQALRQRIDRDYRLTFPNAWVRRGNPHTWIMETHRARALFEPIVEVRNRGFGSQHIPQMIPKEWLTLFVQRARFPHSESQLLRRVIPVQMVQAVTGLDFQQAAEFLGMPTEWITGPPRRLHPLRLHRTWQICDFPGAVEHLAEHIAGEPLTDYEARRRVFADWRLDDPTWDRLCQHRTSSRRGPSQQTRDCASALIWNRLTGSEYILAPVFHPALSASGRELRASSPELLSITHWDRNANRSQFFPEVFAAVEDLATQMVRTAAADTR
ncbi:TniQ family protein [Streptomyces sp. NPDC057910]|uniref:TniQ family protein n=1 Tax=Streptomyces sp. NPDC057910 TaxID=3346278 RepID=UPI0036E01249